MVVQVAHASRPQVAGQYGGLEEVEDLPKQAAQPPPGGGDREAQGAQIPAARHDRRVRDAVRGVRCGGTRGTRTRNPLRRDPEAKRLDLPTRPAGTVSTTRAEQRAHTRRPSRHWLHYTTSETAVTRTSAPNPPNSNPSIDRKPPRAAFLSAVSPGSSSVTVR